MCMYVCEMSCFSYFVSVSEVYWKASFCILHYGHHYKDLMLIKVIIDFIKPNFFVQIYISWDELFLLNLKNF